MQLVGRTAELADVVADLGAGRSVLLTGEAGIGKSALADAAVGDLARRPDVVVWRVFANSATGDVPLGALSAGVPVDLRADPAGPASALKRAAERNAGSTIIVVDDAHDLDVASAVALAAVGDAGAARLVVTQRTGTELAVPLARAVDAGRIRRHDLRRLGRDEVGALVRSIVVDDVDPATIDFVDAVTLGNPYFVRELVLAARAVGSGPGFALSAVPAGNERLSGLLGSRLRELDEPARTALEAVAATEPIGRGILLPELDDRLLDDLVARRFVIVWEDERRLMVRIAHPLVGELLRTSAPAARRRWQGLAARRILDRGARRRDDVMRVAHWALAAGERTSSRVLVDAARMAAMVGENELADRFATAAFEQHPSFETGQALEAVLRRVGDPTRLRSHHRRWEPHALDPEQRATVLVAACHLAFFRHGDADPVDRLLAAAAELGEEAAARTLSVGASTLLMSGRPLDAARIAEPLIGGPPGEALAYAAIAAGHGFCTAGRTDHARDLVDRAIATFIPLGDYGEFVGAGVLGNVRADIDQTAGRFDDARRTLERSTGLGRRAADPTTLGLALMYLAQIDLVQDRLADAEARASEAVSVFRDGYLPGMERVATTVQAFARLGVGDLAGAAELLDRIEHLTSPMMAVFDSEIHRLRGRLAWIRGDPDGASAQLGTGAELARRAGSTWGCLLCLHDLARIGRPADAAHRLTDVERSADGVWMPAQIDQIVGLADRDEAALRRALEAFDRMDTPVFAAECAEALAELVGESGRRAEANELLAHAADHRRRAESTGRLGLAPVAGASLTRRERDVARLAAQGLSSRVIGDRLSISVRTVESHLSRIYPKLGVNDRAGLARVLDLDLDVD